MSPFRRGTAVLLAFLFPAVTAAQGNNVLVIVADDVGVDMLASYGEGAGLDPAATPNVDLHAGQGVLFRNVWSNPTCSPTRATVQTGRYGFHTGVLAPTFETNDDLPLCELKILQVLDMAGMGHVHAGGPGAESRRRRNAGHQRSQAVDLDRDRQLRRCVGRSPAVPRRSGGTAR